MSEDERKLVEILNEELGLTPYESKAYITLLVHGPLSPRGVNQKSGIPRPRTYDVLNSLVGKGLLMEEPGRPRMYAAVNPKVGLEKMVMELERQTIRRLEEKRKTVDKLSFSLTELYDVSHKTTAREERVWVTRRDTAFIAKYCEAIRNMERELVVATPATRPPEKDVLEAVKYALKNNKSVRVIRQITTHWTRNDLDEYERLIRLGDQVRYLKYDGLRFAVFDKTDIVFVLPPEGGSQFAVWISSLPSLATILHEHFETLWNRGEPAITVLKRLKEAKV